MRCFFSAKCKYTRLLKIDFPVKSLKFGVMRLNYQRNKLEILGFEAMKGILVFEMTSWEQNFISLHETMNINNERIANLNLICFIVNI